MSATPLVLNPSWEPACNYPEKQDLPPEEALTQAILLWAIFGINRCIPEAINPVAWEPSPSYSSDVVTSESCLCLFLFPKLQL